MSIDSTETRTGIDISSNNYSISIGSLMTDNTKTGLSANSTINVNVHDNVENQATLNTLQTNDTYSISDLMSVNSSKDGLSKNAMFTVAVPNQTTTLSVTSNTDGTPIVPESPYIGFSSVEVNVPMQQVNNNNLETISQNNVISWKEIECSTKRILK